MLSTSTARTLATSALRLILVLTLLMSADAGADDVPCLTPPGNTSSRQCAIEFINKGNKHWQEGDFDLGIAAYTEAIRIGTTLDVAYLSFAYLSRGALFAKKGEYEKALSDYNSLTTIDPHSHPAYRGKAAVLLRQGHFREALKDINRALWIAPGGEELYKMRARIYAALGRIDEAVADNSLAGRLFLYSNPGTFRARLYRSDDCDNEVKHQFQISIKAGKVAMQPLHIGTDGYISRFQYSNGMIFRIGKDGCRFDLKIAKDTSETESPVDPQHDAEKIILPLKAEGPSFTQALYPDPTPACAYANVLIRAYWGAVEFSDTYSLPPGLKRALNLSRQYGGDGCKIWVQVIKVD
jgi:tetratricopeptide (TPR) repeat protein